MATMEPVNKPGKRRRGRCKKGKQSHYDALSRQMFPAVAPGNPEKCDLNENQLSLHQQSLPPLHMACLYGELVDVQLLVKFRQQWINSSDSQGHRPLHMVLSYKSFPRTCACLRYLLEHDADVNATTDLGQTPLHLAASEGFLDCAEILVKAGADVLAKDSLGQTPLDLACIWCHRKVARYLKSCMWHVNKEKERKERVLVQALYTDLVGMAKQNNLTRKTLTDEKVAEWAKKKGVALLKDFSLREQVSKYHTKCFLADQSNCESKHAKAHCEEQQPEGIKEDRNTLPKPPFKPWSIFTGLQPKKPLAEPDLRDSVTIWRDSSSRQLQYTTRWDSTPRPAPNLPLDVLERVLFPRAFPSRITWPQDFESQNMVEVKHQGCPQEHNTSPWTEVAMCLVEVLEFRQY
ncbi:ankyrin repeat domain-containing protein 53 [Astatotilapia calliptera]|uniref:ankyrin repeat domain-containing protein 53 n=1 Tax=Astatotilapia calliptera TaxID=8154 RepID=UPI000E425B0A|nr:ankyrin repeat domain-containing protein 53 [Astatotilapia calliptera]